MKLKPVLERQYLALKTWKTLKAKTNPSKNRAKVYTLVETAWTFYMFLVGAFSFKEKSPTITVGSFFSRRLFP